MIKQQLISYIFWGLILLSIFLNFVNGYLQIIYKYISKKFTNFKLVLLSFCILLIPVLWDFLFSNENNSIVTAILSASITLIVRELYSFAREKNDIQAEILSELSRNKKSLIEWFNTYCSLKGNGATFTPGEWNKALPIKWKNQAYNNYLIKLESRKIYNQDIIKDLRYIYETIDTAINSIADQNDTFRDPEFLMKIYINGERGAINEIDKLLKKLNP